ncbi:MULTISPECIES: hypothetical protein [Pseudomonas]|jgi:hypothetical protein|uniref:Outer membrane protein beta-barrel domain-containing protein n=1 Tax=Serpens gallinarum TaxID=2763075 RepID=A0ABR8TPV6_9PSED|nr:MULTISPECIES: hypothetical protein [Pseudomonas]MBD7977796.1 hypothetical protein [Serpens gallinarum]MBF0674880.1 hypothetical protein [Pseudomonas sp.]
MKRLLSISTLAAAIFPVVALATPVTGDQEITLSGAGSSDKDFDSTVMAVQGSWGQYLSEQSLWGIRQSINIRDDEGDDTKFDGSTRVFYDYHFGTGNTRPFIGVSLGGVYGEQVEESFMAGPEIGIKHWVADKTFITAMAEYQFLFESGSEADDRFDDGLFLYSLGIGYNF